MVHKKINFLWLLVVFLLSQSAMASSSLEYRHGFRHHSDQHDNRVKFKYSTRAFYYGGQVKFTNKERSDGSRPAFGKIDKPEAKLLVGTKHNFKEHWQISPGLRVGGGDGFHATDAQIKLSYDVPDSPLSTYLRYRREIKNYHEKGVADKVQNKVTFLLDYSFSANVVWFKTDFKASENHLIYNNKKQDYVLQMGAARTFSDHWYGFLDFSDVSADAESSRRQLRTRMGVKYLF